MVDLYLQIFFTTLAVSFGILHLILFIYNRQKKANLFFAVFLFLYALNIFFDYQASMAQSWNESLTFLRFHRSVVSVNPIFALLFIYFAFDLKIPKYFWGIVAVFLITGFFAVLDPIKNFDFIQYIMIGVMLEFVRIFITVLKEKKHDAWIIAIGFSLLFLFSLYDTLLDLRVIQPVYEINNGYPFGFLFLIIFSSIYLSRDFALTNKIMLKTEREAREMEISKRIIEIENQRKTKELEDARNIQLSLLPQCVNNIQNYSICFNMKTATEVGGDYFDYNITDDGEITIVIGDATDHGMKAGMMVSIVKSLFLTHVENTEIKDFLIKCSRTIKKMNLKNLFMALMLVKLKDNKLTVSSAGIPPFLIYRSKTKQIEEYKIKGMPLGVVDSFPYETIETELFSGDTVLLMTDGFPELFNNNRESFGYDRLKKVFLDNINLSVNEIIDKLFSAGDEWRGEFKQNDDITFVAFRLN